MRMRIAAAYHSRVTAAVTASQMAHSMMVAPSWVGRARGRKELRRQADVAERLAGFLCSAADTSCAHAGTAHEAIPLLRPCEQHPARDVRCVTHRHTYGYARKGMRARQHEQYDQITP